MSNVTVPIAGPRPAPASVPPAADPGGKGERPDVRAWQGEDFSFADVLDIVNPLQHIPLLNRVYRDITGDEIGTASKIAGGTLFGGAIGLVASLADTVIEETTGESPAGHLIAMVEAAAGPTETATKIATASAETDDTYAPGTDVAEITGQNGCMDLEFARADGGRWAVQMAMADAEARRESQIAAVPSALDTTPRTAGRIAETPIDTAPTRRSTRALARSPAVADPATAMQPLTTRAAPLTTPGLAGPLPAPEALAANPEMIARARGGAGPGADHEGWMQLMRAAGETRGQGPGGLATAAIAKAVAAYGGAGR